MSSVPGLIAAPVFFLLTTYSPARQSSQQAEETVYGWGVNTSRDTRLYVLPDNLTTVISSDCPADLLLVVVVCSAPANSALRSAIRDTWASLATSTVKVFFLLGLSHNATVNSLIRNESQSYGDIIQESFLDSYNNLTIKSVLMLKWVLWNCPSFRFLMKSDDDLFLNLPHLLEILRPVANKSGLLMGQMFTKTEPNRNSSTPWYMPRYMFQDQFYPEYLSGSGYLMSGDVSRRLFQAALDTPIIHVEDVFITGVCAKAAGITPTSHVGFNGEKKRINLFAISSHGSSPEDMRQAFSILASRTMKPSSTEKDPPGPTDLALENEIVNDSLEEDELENKAYRTFFIQSFQALVLSFCLYILNII